MQEAGGCWLDSVFHHPKWWGQFCSVLGHSVVAPVPLHGGFPHGPCSSPLRWWAQVFAKLLSGVPSFDLPCAGMLCTGSLCRSSSFAPWRVSPRSLQFPSSQVGSSLASPGFSVGFRVSICPVLECSVVPSVSVCWVRRCKSSLRTTFLGRRLAAAYSNLLCAVMLCGAFGSDVLGTLLRIFTLCFKSSL